MKTIHRILLLAATLCAAAIALPACSDKQNAPAAPESKDLQQAASDVASKAQDKAADAKSTVDAAAANVQQQATAQSAAAQGQVQTLMDKAKTLVADKKYSDALTTINDLSKLQLTPDQQKWVADLKAQVQKAMASQATGNLLDTTK